MNKNVFLVGKVGFFWRGVESLFLLCYYLMPSYQRSQWLSACVYKRQIRFLHVADISAFPILRTLASSYTLTLYDPSEANDHLVQENGLQNHLSQVFCENHQPVTFRFWLGEIKGDVP